MEEHECTSWNQTESPWCSSGRLCVGTRGKDMGTGNVYRGRRDTLHSRQPSGTHGTTEARKHHSS